MKILAIKAGFNTIYDELMIVVYFLRHPARVKHL